MKSFRSYLRETDEIESSKDMEQLTLEFFLKNPNPSDDEIHKFAENNEFSVDELEALIYTFATKYANLVTGGRSKGMEPEDVDPEQVRMGIEVEKEHTKDEDIAKKIAWDHLHELKDYYTRLEKMEEEGLAHAKKQE